MTYTVFKESTDFHKRPRNRINQGVLDSARFRTFVAQELNISVKISQVLYLVDMAMIWYLLLRYSYAGGIPLETLIPKARLEAIVERTRKGGGEIVNLLGNGSAYYAPAASLVEMTEAILKDQRRILPAIAYLER